MKYKTYLIFFTVLFLNNVVAQQHSQNKFLLTVDIRSLQPRPEKIIISYYDYEMRRRVSDTASAITNKVVFKGTLTEPVLAQLNQFPPIPDSRVVPSDAMSKGGVSGIYYYSGTSFFLEAGNVKVIVKDSIKSIAVVGSTSQNDFLALQQMKKPYSQKQTELISQIAIHTKSKDSISLLNSTAAYKTNISELRESVYKPFIKKHADNSSISLIALQELSDYGRASFDEFEILFNSISPKYNSLPSALALKQRVFTNTFTSLGAIAPDFTQNDTLNNPVSLSSFRGKYVLLDFWASWCGPCRKENPNLVNSFLRFKNKGFTVLGVSLDQPGKRDLWMKAIHDDQLTWTHVSDLNYWNNAAARMYGISGVPSNFLIDPNGKIVAKNLRGEALNKKLSEILDN